MVCFPIFPHSYPHLFFFRRPAPTSTTVGLVSPSVRSLSFIIPPHSSWSTTPALSTPTAPSAWKSAHVSLHSRPPTPPPLNFTPFSTQTEQSSCWYQPGGKLASGIKKCDDHPSSLTSVAHCGCSKKLIKTKLREQNNYTNLYFYCLQKNGNDIIQKAHTKAEKAALLNSQANKIQGARILGWPVHVVWITVKSS